MFDRTWTKARLIAALLGVLLGAASVLLSRLYGEERVLGDRNSFENGRTHAGEPLDVDLPQQDHMQNIGSKVDGAGMCVMSSIEMAARWAGLEEYRGLRDWCAREPGGGYPSKVDQQLAAYAKSKGLPPPQYVQYEGPDPGPVIEAALKSGRMACITYGWSPRYPGQSYIAHMVSCVKASGRFSVVLDNNYPGEARYEWMDRDELTRRCKFPQSTGWVFVWTAAPPPPSPRNQ
ncbi:MAG TPA: hypothetical protein VEI97_08130 [bacterium]|nr:hypothetical protein [bacterium]